MQFTDSSSTCEQDRIAVEEAITKLVVENYKLRNRTCSVLSEACPSGLDECAVVNISDCDFKSDDQIFTYEIITTSDYFIRRATPNIFLVDQVTHSSLKKLRKH